MISYFYLLIFIQFPAHVQLHPRRINLSRIQEIGRDQAVGPDPVESSRDRTIQLRNADLAIFEVDGRAAVSLVTASYCGSRRTNITVRFRRDITARDRDRATTTIKPATDARCVGNTCCLDLPTGDRDFVVILDPGRKNGLAGGIIIGFAVEDDS